VRTTNRDPSSATTTVSFRLSRQWRIASITLAIRVKEAGPVNKDDDDSFAEEASLLAALANPHRLRILVALSKGEASVGELEKHVDLTQSALSQHLAKLRHDRLVKTRRDAQMIFYSTIDPRVLRMLEVLTEIFVVKP